jgi:tetratricopeptide (TPR) repeat protein
LAVQEELVAEFPIVRAYRHAVALTYLNLANLELERENYEATITALTPAADILAGLTREFSGDADYWHALGNVITLRAGVESKQERHAEALEFHQQAIDHHRTALKVNDRHRMYRMQYAMTCGACVESLLKLRLHAEAAERIDEFLAYVPPRDLFYFKAAQLAAECARLAEQDEELPSAAQAHVMSVYSANAIKYLSAWAKALAPGSKHARTMLQHEPAFDPIRARPEFRQFLESLQSPPLQ